MSLVQARHGIDAQGFLQLHSERLLGLTHRETAHFLQIFLRHRSQRIVADNV